MSNRETFNLRQGRLRIDFVPAEHYTSPQFLQLEKEHVWPRVWQVACREEELPTVGSYATYDIMDESIVVVRVGEKQLKAFYNVCQHRGRRLTDGFGQMRRFHCRFHGWQWKLDGSVERIWDRQDWEGCPDFTDGDLHLQEVRVDTWAGFVFVNMDPNGESLQEFLGDVPRYLDPFEIEKMRYRWYASIKIPCNWKVAMEAFNEGYHVAATHPQLLTTYGDDTTRVRIHGRHGMFYLPMTARPYGAPSPKTGLPMPDDLRKSIIEYNDLINHTLRAVYTDRDAQATRRLMELDPDTPPEMMVMKMIEFQREAAIAAGVGWPNLTMEQMFEAGADWHVFPNLIVLPYPDASLCYRALPDADSPDRCIFEVYSLERYAPGAEPKLVRQRFYGDEDYRDFKSISQILHQDFSNMGEVQRGMKSRGFRGARTNPVQEKTVSNFHRALWEYIEEGTSAQPRAKVK